MRRRSRARPGSLNLVRNGDIGSWRTSLRASLFLLACWNGPRRPPPGSGPASGRISWFFLVLAVLPTHRESLICLGVVAVVALAFRVRYYPREWLLFALGTALGLVFELGGDAILQAPVLVGGVAPSASRPGCRSSGASASSSSVASGTPCCPCARRHDPRALRSPPALERVEGEPGVAPPALRVPGELRRARRPVQLVQGAGHDAGHLDRSRHHRRRSAAPRSPRLFPLGRGDDAIPRATAASSTCWSGTFTPADHERIQATRSDVFALVEVLAFAGDPARARSPLREPQPQARRRDARAPRAALLDVRGRQRAHGRAPQRRAAHLAGRPDPRSSGVSAESTVCLPRAGAAGRHAVVGGSDDHETPRAPPLATRRSRATAEVGLVLGRHGGRGSRRRTGRRRRGARRGVREHGLPVPGRAREDRCRPGLPVL